MKAIFSKKNINKKKKLKKGFLEIEWNEIRKILLVGREREVFIKLKVFREEFGNYYDTYIYSFLDGYRITLLKAKIDNEEIPLQINEHSFIFNFRKLYNGDSIKLYLKYREKKSKQKKIYRSECISLPDFLIGAKVNFTLYIPKFYDIYNWKKKNVFKIKECENKNDINEINENKNDKIDNNQIENIENKIEINNIKNKNNINIKNNENNIDKVNENKENLNINNNQNKDNEFINQNNSNNQLIDNKNNINEKIINNKNQTKSNYKNIRKLNNKKDNIENLNENNYIFTWNGEIDNGRIIEDYIYMNMKTTKWKISFKQNFKTQKSKKAIRELIITMPKYFKGGNNNIIEYNIKTDLSNKIDDNFIKESEKNIQLKYNNLSNGNGFYLIESIIENSSVKNYTCENFNMFLIKVSDKEKEIFTPLIKQILKEDKTNNLDYIKIGYWVKKNINYDKHIPIIKKNPIETFKSKKGTCNDLTNLYNCLLKIIGIKAIFVSGYVIEENKYDNNGGNDFDYHCWSLAEINNKFIPLDVNFQYFNGKIPNTHLFGCFGNSNIDIKCTEKIILDKIEENIINIE